MAFVLVGRAAVRLVLLNERSGPFLPREEDLRGVNRPEENFVLLRRLEKGVELPDEVRGEVMFRSGERESACFSSVYDLLGPRTGAFRCSDIVTRFFFFYEAVPVIC